MQRSISWIYFVFLGLIIGVEIAAGAILAPVVFNPSPYLGEGVLSHFQSGILMTQVFLRFNILLFVWAMFSWGFEAYMLRVGSKDKFTFLLLFLCSICIYFFVFYFTPFIVEAQQNGAEATKSNEFATIHEASEISIKVLLILQLLLFYRRYCLIFKKNDESIKK